MVGRRPGPGRSGPCPAPLFSRQAVGLLSWGLRGRCSWCEKPARMGDVFLHSPQASGLRRKRILVPPSLQTVWSDPEAVKKGLQHGPWGGGGLASSKEQIRKPLSPPCSFWDWGGKKRLIRGWAPSWETVLGRPLSLSGSHLQPRMVRLMSSPGHLTVLCRSFPQWRPAWAGSSW